MKTLPRTSLTTGAGRLGMALLSVCLLDTASCSLKSRLTGNDSSPPPAPPTGPVLSLSPGTFDFGDTDKISDTLSLWNSGIDSLDYTLTIDPGNGPANWLTTTPASGSSTGEVDPIEVDVRRDLLAPGTINGKVHVTTGGRTTDVPVAVEIVGVTPSVTSYSFGSSSGPYDLDVWNGGGGTLHYDVNSAPSWLKLDRWNGTSTGTSDKSRIHVTVDRSGSPPGHYSGTVVIDPDSNQGTHGAKVQFDMDVPSTGGILSVTPSTDFQSSGSVGGPFSPASIDYVIQNVGDGDLDWTASVTQSWLDLSLAGGTLSPNQQVTETVSIDQGVAATLSASVYHDVVTLLNATNGNGNTSRNANLTVTDPNLQAIIYTTPNPMTIAPYTTLFSGMDSVAGAAPIVKWNWDFGDGGTGNPQTDEEMLVVHRFDNPGTYTIKLTVTDENGNTNDTTMSLTVASFSGKTFYVSSSAGSDSNDGSSSSRAFKTLDYAFSKMASNRQNNPDKLLLACGDKWTSSGDLGPPKPSILDCYGSGAQPVIEFSNANNGIGWYGGSGGTPDTWGYSPIVQNLHIRYTVKNGSDNLVNPFIRGSTFRNCTVENGGIIGSLQREGLVIEGCNVSWASSLCVYSSGSNVVLRSSTFTGAGTDNTYHHQVYLNNGSRWLLQDCVFDGANTGLNNNAAKLNGGTGVVVRRCEARGSRNGFDAGRNLEENSSPPADNYLYDECIAHDNGFGGQAAGLFVSWIRHLTVRNCVFYNHDPSGGGCGAIWLWSSNDSNNNVNLYHNVFYSNTIPDIYFSSAQYNLVMRNNIFLRDTSGNTGSFIKMNDSGSMMKLIDADHDVYFWNGKSASDAGFGFNAGDANTSFNTWQSDGKDAAGKFADPQFNDPVNLDFTLKEGSQAIDEGVLVPSVLKDKAGVARPQGKAPDAGVFEK